MVRAFFIAAVLCSNIALAQNARIVKLDDIQRLIHHTDESIHVINFWATWCAPCIRELPYFEEISAKGIPGVKVTLISMDLDLDPNPQKVYKFIEKKGIRSEVLLLDEDDPNSYIDKIESQWSGALPATLIVNHKTGKRIFIERTLYEDELEQLINDLL